MHYFKNKKVKFLKINVNKIIIDNASKIFNLFKIFIN